LKWEKKGIYLNQSRNFKNMKEFIDLILEKQHEIYRRISKKPHKIVLHPATVDKIGVYLLEINHLSTRVHMGVQSTLRHIDIDKIIRSTDLEENEIEFIIES
jgi:putative methionine-R-sulfoxide reductase with GAF domain